MPINESDIEERKPEELLKPEHVEEYKLWHKDIWDRLIQINTSIMILESIQKYPIDNLFFPPENIFLERVYWNFTYTCVVMLHGLISDQSSNSVVTLRHFKNHLISTWLKDSEKASFQEGLKQNRFSDNFKLLEEKSKNMRHKVIAHRDRKTICESIPGLSISELRSFFNETEVMFRFCTFGGDYHNSLYPPSSHKGKPEQKDIDYLMELLIKNSPWFNSPEIQAPYWSGIREHKSKEFLEELNRWRRKFGFPDA